MVAEIGKRTSARRRNTLKHFFIPGPHNVYRPLFLRLEAAAVTAVIILLLFALALGVEKLVVKSPSPQVGAVVASVLVDLANADRSAEGLGELIPNPTLQQAAQMKADDMASKGYFAHETPDGFTSWHWFGKAGYDFRYAGENLAVYFSDSAEVEKAWMNSPLHRANILSDKFTEIGIAIAHGRYQDRETTFVVQMFGDPSETSAASIVESSRPDGGEAARVAGVSAEAKPIGAITSRTPSNTLWRILTSPKTTLQYTYMVIAALVLLAISLLFLVELRRLHVPSFFRGVGLLALIGMLLWSGTLLSGQLLIL